MTSEQDALAEIAPQLKVYLVELANLRMSTTQEERDAFELTAQHKLAILEGAITEVRQKYELPDLTDSDVISFGVNALIRSLPVFKSGTDYRNADLAATVENAIGEALRSDLGITLRGLLAQARTYQLPNR